MTHLYKKEQNPEIRPLQARVERVFAIINKLFFGFVLLGLVVLIGGMMPFFFSPGMSGLGYTLIAALIYVIIFFITSIFFVIMMILAMILATKITPQNCQRFSIFIFEIILVELCWAVLIAILIIMAGMAEAPTYIAFFLIPITSAAISITAIVLHKKSLQKKTLVSEIACRRIKITALILIPILLVAILLTLVLGFVCYPQP